MIRMPIIAMAAALVFCSGAAMAQSNPPKPAAPHKPAKPKPVTQASVAASTYGEPGRVSDYWTIEKALPDKPRGRTPGEPIQPNMGRVPLQDSPGSVGLTSGQIRSTQFYDGREVPGLDRYHQQDTSYVGMSLSVPSGSNSFIIPVLPPPGGSNGW